MTARKEMSCAERYDRFKKLLEISEENPEEVMSYWDEIVGKLRSTNSFHRYHRALFIPRLAKADKGDRIEKVIDEYLRLLKDESFVVAINTANNLGRIAKAKPKLRDKITKALLSLDKTKHKHKDLLKSGAVVSFNEYFNESGDKARILEFVKSLLITETSPKAKKLAREFLKKWEK